MHSLMLTLLNIFFLKKFLSAKISEQQKTEKVDILGMCYEVFKNVAVLLNENPG